MKMLLPLLLISGSALADDDAILRCRQLPDGPVRLECYNAIRVGATAARPVAAAPAVMPSAAAPAEPFPLPAPKKSAAPEPEVVTSIAGVFDGWVAGQTIRLANGQVWQVVDGSEYAAELRDPKVTIQRGLLGAIFLDIEGAHRSPKVRRVK